MQSAADLSFLHGQSVPRCTHVIDKTFAEYQTLQFCQAGGVELTIGSEAPRRLIGRWFWSGFAGPRIAFHVAKGFASWRHRYIAFRGPLVSQWTAEGLFPVLPQRAPARGAFGKRFDEVLTLSTRSDRWGSLRAIHALEGMLIELAEARAGCDGAGFDEAGFEGTGFEGAGNALPGRSWVNKAMQQLSDCATHGREQNYAALADSLGMAESTFRRRFRSATGVPPHGYVLQCRANAARQLLADTDLPVKTIARQLGYQDVFFFTRQFRKLIGVPPALYRKSRHG